MHDENYLIKSETLEDIADAIREKTGSQDTIAVSDFASEIENIPSGGGDLDWSAIGYESTPQAIVDGYNYALQIQNEWTTNSKLANYPTVLICPLVDTSNKTTFNTFADGCNRLISVPLLDTSNSTSTFGMFRSCSTLTTVPLFDTSSVTDMSNMFNECTNLITTPLFDASNVTNMSKMFYKCTNLTTVPLFNTNKVTNISTMFYNCSSLTTIPQFNTSKITNMQNAFQYCPNLSNETLNNIMAMCINATSYTGTKTLKYIGLTSAQATTCESLSNYQDLLNAGWTKGY